MTTSHSFLALQACVRNDLPAVGAHLSAALAAGESLVAAAIDHGLSPLLYQRLEEGGLLERLPAGEAQRLRELHRRTLTIQAGAFDLTLQTVALLAEHGISGALPLKGVALAALMWPDYLPRSLVDLDLLVDPEQVGKAREILLGAGFEAPPIPWAPTPWDYHLPRLEHRGLGIELHWRLWPRSPLQPFRLPGAREQFERSITGMLNGQPVRVPSAPDQFLTFAASLAQDGFAVGLRQWADLHWLRQRFAPGDEERLWELAQECGLQGYLELVTRALCEVLGLEAGERRESGDTDEAYRLLSPVIWRRLLTPDPPRTSLWMLRALARDTAPETDWLEQLPRFLRSQVRPTSRSAVTHCGGVLLAGGKLATRTGRLLFSRKERLALRDDLLLARGLGRL